MEKEKNNKLFVREREEKKKKQDCCEDLLKKEKLKENILPKYPSQTAMVDFPSLKEDVLLLYCLN